MYWLHNNPLYSVEFLRTVEISDWGVPRFTPKVNNFVTVLCTKFGCFPSPFDAVCVILLTDILSVYGGRENTSGPVAGVKVKIPSKNRTKF